MKKTDGREESVRSRRATMRKKILLFIVVLLWLLSMFMLVGCKEEKTDDYIDVEKITIYSNTYVEITTYKEGTFADLELNTNATRDYFYNPKTRIIKQKNTYTDHYKECEYYRYFQVSESVIVLYQ